MACLNNFISASLRSSKKESIAALHKFVFESEGDRSNRQRLREFTGFDFAENDQRYGAKKEYAEDNLTQADLVAICNVLGIGYRDEDLHIHIFRNLKKNSLLASTEADEDETDDETDGEAENVVFHTPNRATNAERSDENVQGADEMNTRRNVFTENDSMSTPRFAISFRDVEESIRSYDGTNTIPIEVWIEEYEEQATLMYWNDFQKFLFAKKSLKGIAKLFVLSERGLNSWNSLKVALLSEFKSSVSSKLVHEQLAQTKRGNNECVFEYFYRMKDIASRGKIADDALIQYLIDGIEEKSVNKTILYGAKNMSQFKDKLKCFGTMIAKENQSEKDRPKRNENSAKEKDRKNQNVNKDAKKEVKCYNCGEKGHVLNNCQNKEKGRKCYKCNQYGHISKECANIDKNVLNTNTRSLISKNDLTSKEVYIGNKKCTTLFDTGSKFNIIREDFYCDIGKPKLESCNVVLIGFGSDRDSNKIKPLGQFKQQILIDEEDYLLDFYVVPIKFLDIQLIIGEQLCLQAEIVFNCNGLQVRKNKRNNEQNFLNICVEVDNELFDINEAASEYSKQKVRELISNYEPVKTKTTNVEMRIVLNDESPIFSRPRRLAFSETRIVDEQIKEWLENDIIEESTSEFTSPIVLVKKHDGSVRLCVDYRRINKVIVKDHFPLPLIEDQLDRLQEAKIFSTIDLKNGFFHVPVAESSRKYTSFVTHRGQYQFLKVPFGFSNSPGVFQRHVNAIFRDLSRRGIALPYVDDIIIPAKTEQDAVQNLKEVIATCKDYGLQLNLKKCNFLKTRIQFLGHVIENRKIYPSPEKIEAVSKFKMPQTIKQIESFLGLTGYFRKFIPNYAGIARPLTELTKKNAKFRFDLDEENAVNILKKLLTENPVLSIYNQAYETEVHTDASIDGFGAVLLQMNDGQLHPVYFMSKKTTDAQRKYSSYELEILAVIEALTKFRVYLLGIHFKLVTDCNAFTKTLEKQSLCTRVARWILFLQEYNYTVEHRSGVRMKHVDALSRYPVMLIKEDSISTALKDAQARDEKIRAIKEVLSDENKVYDDYFLKGSVLYKLVGDDELIVVPNEMQKRVISSAHDRGHFAAKKTKELICREFFIPHVEDKIKKYIECCIPCILTDRKRGKQEGLLHPLQKEDVPLFTYHIDFLGPLESTHKDYKHILAVIDSFTKFCWLYPTKSTTANEVIVKLSNQSVNFGNPAFIISDRGSAFTSQDFVKYCEDEGIKLVKTTTGLPRVNGQVERLNSIIISVLSKLSVDDPTKWYRNVNRVQQAINSTFTRSINTTPFELLVGVKMRTKDDLQIRDLINKEAVAVFNEERSELRMKAKTQILKLQNENKKDYNLRRKQARQYDVGDLIAIKRTQFGSGLKLKPKFLGPYKVVKVKYNNAYDVQKVGNSDGPKNSATCAEYMKPWPIGNDDSDDDGAFGSNA